MVLISPSIMSFVILEEVEFEDIFTDVPNKYLVNNFYLPVSNWFTSPIPSLNFPVFLY